MSRVFLAEDVELDRRVVIKVLPPEMGAGVNVERFQREIKLAASLQHPHIVPLLTAGSSGDLLYYVMPFIEGESLRVKLSREGELPVRDVLWILKEVADALSYAHEHGVVHRDIKPDNVLLSGKHAVVTDFGVAKAVSTSTGGQSLTSLGMALGTPAYMAPEQAAGDPNVDHRADIYALGALAYEMLCGRPPFTGGNPQAILSAQVTQQPDPVITHRGAVPAALNAFVLRCLEKKAADRWQTAEELMAPLESMATPSGGMTPTGTTPVPSAVTEIAEHHPVKVAALFGLAAAVTLVIVYGLMIALGLPDWVFVGAIALLAIGLPIILTTGHHERRRGVARTRGLATATPVGLRKYFTWGKAIGGGGLAFAGLAVVAGGYMTTRALGIGPAATLMATGALGQREMLILSEFENRTADSTLGSTVTELLRVSLSESPVVRIADPARLAESKARMQLPPDAKTTGEVAREIAERESIKAIIAGEVVPLGEGYLVSARLVSATGEVLTAQQASAGNVGELIQAVDELSGKLRERIGESLRSIRRTLPLELVTTGSLRALRLYTQATQAEIAGDADRALALLEEAVAADSTFAMAYRKIGTVLANNFEQRARAREAVIKAYELRDRLTEQERGYAIAQYHSNVTGRRDEALAAYRTILERYPEDHRALNNSGVLYSELGDDERARQFYERALRLDSTWSLGFSNLAFEQKNLGQFAEAAQTLDAMEARFPGNPDAEEARGMLALAQRDFAGAEQHFANVRASQRGNLSWEAQATEHLAFTAAMRGRFGEGNGYLNDALAAHVLRGTQYSAQQRLLAWWNSSRNVALGRPGASSQRLDRAASSEAMATLPVADRWYEALIEYYALVDLDRARSLLRDMEASGQPELNLEFGRAHERAGGWVALRSGGVERGLSRMRAGVDGWGCQPCGFVTMARAHDIAGNADSSVHYWEAYQESNFGIPSIDTQLPIAYRRLGELYEARGDRERAAQYYHEFVELWKDADPELQPQVTEVRKRLSALVGERP
jgi:serine/threonine-protein kinase